MRVPKPLGIVAVVAVVAAAYFLGVSGRNATGQTMVASLPDPGYAARDAVVIETGYDGRERYRLNARVIRQSVDSNVIDLESLQMDYHPGAQGEVPGEKPAKSSVSDEVWHLSSDRGQVRGDGDDVQLNGNVRVIGTLAGGTGPVTLSTKTLRINTPTEFVDTNDPVTLNWSGHRLAALGMEADLKAGNLRLKSDVRGTFSPK
jgi:LPS export ABC transporter protein LptC